MIRPLRITFADGVFVEELIVSWKSLGSLRPGLPVILFVKFEDTLFFWKDS